MGLGIYSRGQLVVDFSYRGFKRFRYAIAEAVNINLDLMQGFGGDTDWIAVNTPLEPFLNHSDSDGELTPDACRKVWPYLKAAVESANLYELDRKKGLALAKAMKDAAQEDCSLEFK